MSPHDAAFGVALQADGKVVAAGGAWDFLTEESDFTLVRYHPDGSLDNAFDSDGKVVTDIGGAGATFSHGVATDVTVQPDGRLVASGHGSAGSGFVSVDFVVVRYHADGSLDTTFDSDGKAVTDLGGTIDVG